ncbi:MAG: hypothetical protein KC457_37110, partial [Myxococcales bacterium]|nr:hypothetical protein [Myxococcales bacterium]
MLWEEAMTHRLLTALSLSTLVLTGLTGCNGHPIKPVEIDIGTEFKEGLPLDVNKKVDVLLVLD